MQELTDFNNETVSQTSQCTKLGENGEMITVSITTEETHQAAVLGNYEPKSKLNRRFARHTQKEFAPLS